MGIKKWKDTLLLALVALWLSACASKVPDGIRKAPPGSVSPAEARTDGQRLQGVAVRWGGVIAAVENLRDQTRLDVVARPLGSDGNPRAADAPNLGRFLAQAPGFLDPAVYRPGREITVRGTFVGTETRDIGDYPYRYPVVQVQQHYLWAEVRPAPRHYDPMWHDPFWYDPWYPWSPFPWYHRRPPYYW